MTTPRLTPEHVAASPPPLKVYIHPASTDGIGTLSTLIVGEQSAVLIDPPALIKDAESIVSWARAKTDLPISAMFVSHHHPDHFFSSDTIRAAWPKAKLYAAPYICDDINKEYFTKVPFMTNLLGDDVSKNPSRPESYPFSFCILKGNPSSPIVLLGPVQGDCINHTVFWLPMEKVVICGDTMFGRNTHVWCEELESPHNLQAWENVITIIEALRPETLVVGHIIDDLEIDKARDIAHTRGYLEFFRKTIMDHPGKMTKAEIMQTFEEAYPECKKNHADFFMNVLGNHFGNDVNREPVPPPYPDPFTDVLHHNRIHKAGLKTPWELEGFII